MDWSGRMTISLSSGAPRRTARFASLSHGPTGSRSNFSPSLQTLTRSFSSNARPGTACHDRTRRYRSEIHLHPGAFRAANGLTRPGGRFPEREIRTPAVDSLTGELSDCDDEIA